LKTADFDFELPEQLIATQPLRQRDASRMLVVDGEAKDSFIRHFSDHIRPGDVVVFNDTRVIPARLSGKRARGVLKSCCISR
jgi:S-adenosylmethionine:tRNA ribosyltransferase-isomerase